MWRINGLGANQVKLLDVCRPVILQCSLQSDAQPEQPSGLHLHALYVIDSGKIRPAIVGLSGDERDPSMKVEFDLLGQIHLNLPGSLYLTGGDPQYEYELETSVHDYGCSMPSWHPLTRLVLEPQFGVPKYHSRIYTTEFVFQYAVGGSSGWLDHIPVPIAGGSVVYLDGDIHNVITDWWG